jgi:hypothetical protein
MTDSATKPAKQRRHRTGRNQQVNVKATAQTIEHFNRLADELDVPQAEVLERALQALVGQGTPAVQSVPRSIDAHYDADYVLTDADRERGAVKVDPYFVALQWRTGARDPSGVLFHMLKTIARFGDKNSREREIVALHKSLLRLAALENVELNP